MNAPCLELINQITKKASIIYGDTASVSASIRPRPLSLISGGRVIDYHVLNIGPRVFASCLELVIEPADFQDGSCERWVVDDQNSDRPKHLSAILDQHLPLGMFDQIIYRNSHKDSKTEFLPIEGTSMLLKRDRHMQKSEIDEIIEWVRFNASPRNDDWQQGLRDILASKFDSLVGEYRVIDAKDISNLLSQQAKFEDKFKSLERRIVDLENRANDV